MRKDTKLEALAALPLFAGADRRQLDRIAELCTSLRVPAGQVLCREGQVARQLVIVQEGCASVQVGGRPATTLAAGDFFGELALLSGEPYGATVTASSPATVLVLTSRELSALLHAVPFVATRMLEHTRARLWEALAGSPVPAPRTGELTGESPRLAT